MMSELTYDVFSRRAPRAARSIPCVSFFLSHLPWARCDGGWVSAPIVSAIELPTSYIRNVTNRLTVGIIPIDDGGAPYTANLSGRGAWESEGGSDGAAIRTPRAARRRHRRPLPDG